jgi:parvulin-like peptidyl-prolyl isomerase
LGSVGPSAALTALFACAGPTDSPETWSESNPGRLRGPEVAEDVPPTTMVDARPAALVEGRVVDWGDLRPYLSEAAGGEVLGETVLDRMLAEALTDAGITLTVDDVDAERERFYATFSEDPDVAARLAREVRARQGLGPRRFDALLRRNAALRALVRNEAVVTDEAVRRMYDILYGPKRQGRLMILPTLTEAQAAITRVNAGELFADVAVDVSTDASAARGGLLEPISRADPRYPQALREALWGLAPGEVSRPVFLGETYAVLTLIRTVEAEDVPLDEVRSQLVRQVRTNQERILMDDLARQLMAEANITVIDDGIKWSWDARRNK